MTHVMAPDERRWRLALGADLHASERYDGAQPCSDLNISVVCVFVCDRYSFLMYTTYNWLYCVGSLISTMLLYQYFIIHSLYIIVISLVVVWNAAVFYVDVFSVRGFRTES